MIGMILAGGGAVVAGLLGFAASRPPGFRVERRGHVDAPPERVFAKLDDFREWPSWSPWEELDPAMMRTFSGSPSGTGAIYEWSGNKKVGRGRMEIIDRTPSGRVVIKLDFIEPFPAQNVTEFLLQPSGAGTDVTWSMTGTKNFVMKLMGVFVNLDRMIGRDFEKGLARLANAVRPPSERTGQP